jgi:hypothetical protein
MEKSVSAGTIYYSRTLEERETKLVEELKDNSSNAGSRGKRRSVVGCLATGNSKGLKS